MILNRKLQPRVLTIDKLTLPQPGEAKLDNGIPLFLINAGTQDVIKIDFVFKAGSWYQNQAYLAFATNKMILEGTLKFSSSEIAEIFDYYGSYVETQADKDTSNISLFSLNKHLDQTLEVLEEIIKRPTFPENELAIFLRKKKQEFLTNQQKVNFVCRNNFNPLLFGNEHPYGHKLSADVFENIKSENLRDFFQNQYHPANCFIIASGRIEDNLVEKLNKYFGGLEWKNEAQANNLNLTIAPSSQKINFIEKPKAVQSAIRIGRPLFNRIHPDYFGMRVLSTVLGEYFGSRLMKNIREDKGYTYGIGSSMASYIHEGYFLISTEVGTDVCTQAKNEIYSEIDKLRNNPIPAEELELVKNYMKGEILRSFDGPFEIASRFRVAKESGITFKYYENLMNSINTTTSHNLLILANKYLQQDDLFELVVGK